MSRAEPGRALLPPHRVYALPYLPSTHSTGILLVCGSADENDVWLDREYKADGGLPHVFNRLDVDKDHQLSLGPEGEFRHIGYFLQRAKDGIKVAEDDLYMEKGLAIGIHEQKLPGAGAADSKEL